MKLCSLAVLAFSISLIPASLFARQQDSDPPLPPVLSHAQPIYPPIAHTAHIGGDVVATIVTDGELVATVTILSGPPMLAKATEQNLRTWKFAPHPPGTFKVTFRYKLAAEDPTVLFLPERNLVELVTSVPFVTGYFASESLGRWQTDFGAVGSSSALVLQLDEHGSFRGDYLTGALIHPNGDRDNITDSIVGKDGLLVFTVLLTEAGGKTVNAVFTGRMSDKRITGTYLTADDMRGNWNASRLPDN
jgi:Gram-negative bacterial TonB protein C-terminal